MKFEHTEVFNFEGAIRGMRNPLESWNKSDSGYKCESWHDMSGSNFVIGENDFTLMKKLIKAGTDHSKFMRQITVCVDITAPLYWWKEQDTYKVGTVANSTSTMHKLATTPITMNCFETDDYVSDIKCEQEVDLCYTENASVALGVDRLIIMLENLRLKYLETKDKRYWKELIRWLPESWLQKRTVTMSYQNLRAMYFARRNHKLTEWHTFCDWIESLPYSELITWEDKDGNA